MIINLLCLEQMLQLLQACIRASLKDITRHSYPLEDITQLRRSQRSVTLATKTRQPRADLLKRDSITTIIFIACPKGQLASRERARDDLGDLSHTIILFRIT